MKRNLDKDRKALMEDLNEDYLAEMASPAKVADNELVKKVSESELKSSYYCPIGTIDNLRKTKPKHFGNKILMPPISEDLEAKFKGHFLFKTYTYYLGFNFDKMFKFKRNQILDKNEMINLEAEKIVISNDFSILHPDDSVEIIISSDVLNTKFEPKKWIAFFGFEILRQSGKSAATNDSNSTDQKIGNQA